MATTPTWASLERKNWVILNRLGMCFVNMDFFLLESVEHLFKFLLTHTLKLTYFFLHLICPTLISAGE